MGITLSYNGKPKIKIYLLHANRAKTLQQDQYKIAINVNVHIGYVKLGQTTNQERIKCKISDVKDLQRNSNVFVYNYLTLKISHLTNM